jgi:predicted enzyme related to lactoylglutathione lyase
MINITAVPFVGYPVTDLSRARAFYEGILRLTPGEIWESDGRAWIEYNVGPATIAISNMAPEWKPSGDGPSVALEVDDLEAVLAELRTRGVKIVLEPVGSPVCRMAAISDPDGNAIVIHHKHPSP